MQAVCAASAAGAVAAAPVSMSPALSVQMRCLSSLSGALRHSYKLSSSSRIGLGSLSSLVGRHCQSYSASRESHGSQKSSIISAVGEGRGESHSPCLAQAPTTQSLHRHVPSPRAGWNASSIAGTAEAHLGRSFQQGRGLAGLAQALAGRTTEAEAEPVPAQVASLVEESEKLNIELPTNESSEKLLKIRHTAAHVMAMAVQKLFPNARCTIGPWIAKGFYYDFDLQEPLMEKDLKKIKKEMDRIVGRNLPVRREEVSREEAERRIRAIGEPYKLEILEGITSEPITIYHLGDDWWDLCGGPHLERTGQLPRRAIELEAVAGAYWRGDEKRATLQRIYGTAWETEEQLAAYLAQKEEAKRRDHRKLGSDLNLFSIQEDAGGGLVFWHPKGAMVRQIVEDYWKKRHLASGYELLYTPHIAKLDLWKTSGHYDFYKENMFDQMAVEEETYQLKPMNCPCHIMVYKAAQRSYRELPIRWGELGTVYRYERSGTMHGLFRVRGFTQDDAHIFCLPEQMRDEIRGVLDLTEAILADFGFTRLEVNLSTKPEKSVGSDDIWQRATQALREALGDKGWAYNVDEGGGAFYGPKIDLKIEDAIGRKWQCSTIQVDFNLPQRFKMEYVAPDQSRQQPIMIHRAIFGSLERFFGILVENYAGDFPLWLAPVQARLLPVTDSETEYCKQAVAELQAAGVRAEVGSGERLGKLIRNAETQKIPIMAVVGPKEVESNTLTVRARKGGEIGNLSVAALIERIKEVERCKGYM